MPRKDACCIPDCKNSRSNSAVKFHRFPSTKSHEKCRRSWVEFVRSARNNQTWQPSDSSRICSHHFHVTAECDPAVSEPNPPCHILPLTVPVDVPDSNEAVLPAETSDPSNNRGSHNAGDAGPTATSTGHAGSDRTVRTDHADYVAGFEEHGEFRAVRDQFPDAFAYIQKLEKQKCELEQQVGDLKKKIISLETCRGDPQLFNFWTGLPNYESFTALYSYLAPKADNLQQWRGSSTPSTSNHRDINPDGLKTGPSRQLTREEEFFWVLVQLKMGLLIQDISQRAGISTSSFSKLFSTWIVFLFHELSAINKMPSKDRIQDHLPPSFQKFAGTRVIVDCTELFCERPNRLEAQKQTFSNYKHHNTFKFMVGITPSGSFCFVSDTFGGRASDKFVTGESSDFLDQLDVGDTVMADRGFLIDAFLTPLGVNLVMPAFKGSHRDQLTPEEITESRRISEARIHVERAIGRIRSFHIFDSDVKMTQKHLAREIFTVCAYLCNYKPALIKV